MGLSWGPTALESALAGPGSSQVSMTLVSTAGEIPGPGLGPIWHSIRALELTPAGPGSSQVSMTLVSTAGDIPGPGLGCCSVGGQNEWKVRSIDYSKNL